MITQPAQLAHRHAATVDSRPAISAGRSATGAALAALQCELPHLPATVAGWPFERCQSRNGNRNRNRIGRPPN